LAGQEGADWLAQRQGNVSPMVIRTHYFDGCLLHVTREVGLRQVVILAAGLDTRAFRLAWPEGVKVFEIDQPDVLAYKESVMQAAGAQPACQRFTIGADLTAPWQADLIHSGFNPDLPAAWLLEGFLFYLPCESIHRILDEVGALAAGGSWVGFDIINNLTLTSPITKAWIDMQAKAGAPWLGWLDDPEAFMADRGWQAALTQPGQSDANFGRWTLPVIPVKMPTLPHNWYVTAEKIQLK
jgi:methyltransferase (TIGR00027 family)